MKKKTEYSVKTKAAKQRYRDYKKGKKPNILLIILLVILLIAVIAAGVRFTIYGGGEGFSGFSEGDLLIEKSADTQGEDMIQESEGVELESDTGEYTTDEIEIVDLTEGGTESTEEKNGQEEGTLSSEEVEAQVDAYLSTMNIEARVGQLFFITPEELTGIGIAVQAGATTKTMLKTYAVGGMIFTDQNFEVLDQMKLMLSNIKVYSSYPIFLAMDEVGAVRITNTNNTLEETGFNLASVDSTLYLLTEDGNIDMGESLNVVSLEEGNVLTLLEEGADIILVEDGFVSAYDTVVSAVRSGELDESLLEEKVGRILTYKVENGI